MVKRTICMLISACLLVSMLLSAPLTVRAQGETTGETTQATDTTQTPETTVLPTETTVPTTETTVPPTETTVPPTETTAPPTETTVPEDFTENETRMSPEAIALLKQYEGFSKYPHWDVSQWSVGYGTRCPGDKLELWKAVGITEREAESLLNGFINNFGAKLDAFIEKHSLNLNQYQYDALMLLTYNIGAGWTNKENEGSLLQTAIITGATGNDFIYPFVLYCKADRVFSNGLIERRLAEANLYLNGVYGRRPPSDYSFVRFDVNGGKSDYAIQGFDVDEPVPIKVIADTTYTASNGAVYEFDGWYTSRYGGTKVETLDRSFGYGITLYAHWKLIKEGSGPAQDNELGGTTTLVDVLVTAANLNVRLGPGQSYGYAPSRSYPKGTQLTIVETKSGGGYLWGKIANTGDSGYWVALEYTNYYEVIQNQQPTQPPTTQPVEPPTTQPVVPPTTQPVAPPTTQPPTTQPTTPPTTQPTIPPTTRPTEPESEFGTWQGVVKTAGSQLRIRSSANLSASVTGFLNNGASVTIVERKVVGNLEWGRMEKGWISLKYVSFEPVETTPPTTQPAPTQPAPTQPKPTQPAPTQPAPIQPKPTQPVPTQPTQPETTIPPTTEGTVPVTPDGDGYWIGLVNTAILPIRSAAGTSYTIVGYYRLDDSVEVTRCITVGGQLWGRVDDGWICLSQVALDGEEFAPNSDCMKVNTSSLRVRNGAGMEYAIVTFLSFGDTVTVYDRQLVGSTTWGLTDWGWVDLKYLQ